MYSITMTAPTAFRTEFAISLEKRFDKAVSVDKKRSTQAVRALNFHLQKAITQMPHKKSCKTSLFIDYPRNRIQVPTALNDSSKNKIVLCPQVSRGERALSRSSSNSSFLSDVRTSNDSSMGATQWQFQRAENPWSTVLRCVVPVLGLVCDQDAHFPSVPFCRHARILADANTHWQSLSLR